MNKIEEYKRVAKEFPLALTVSRINLKLREKLNLPTKKVMKKKDQQILNILMKEYGDLLVANSETSSKEKQNNIIWVMWLQGFDNAPELVKVCRQYLEKNKPADSQIIELTSENLSDYVSFSDVMIQKIKDGTITYTHLSDLVRTQVLANYGGLWIDSTVLVTKEIPHQMFEEPWTTIKGYPEQGVPFVDCRWTGFIMGGWNNTLYVYLNNLFTRYWNQHNVIIDYLLIDYFIDMVCQKVPEVNKMIEQYPDNNQLVFELLPLLQSNELDNTDKIQELLDSTTIFYKLSYKSVDENSEGVKYLKKKIGD